VTIALPKATQAAEWAPDGSGRLAVTCFDDHLRILPLGDRIMGDPISAPEAEPLINHRTSTGRWLLPFRAIWTAGVCSSAGLLKPPVAVEDLSCQSMTVLVDGPCDTRWPLRWLSSPV
jgi:hypothetical protein